MPNFRAMRFKASFFVPADLDMHAFSCQRFRPATEGAGLLRHCK
jgi:hypothetical protein